MGLIPIIVIDYSFNQRPPSSHLEVDEFHLQLAFLEQLSFVLLSLQVVLRANINHPPETSISSSSDNAVILLSISEIVYRQPPIQTLEDSSQ